jgi:ubiquinone biosynthesis protein UbiJ
MSQTDPAIHTAAVAALEAAANQTLKLDPTAYQRLSVFSGQVFHIDCDQPKFNVYLCPEQSFLRFTAFYDGEATTTIRGSGSEFTKLATSKDPGGVLINSNIKLEGDSAPLIELQKVLSELELDWEAPLVESLGDVLGHQLANIFRALANWGRKAKVNSARQWRDFILEEARLAPSRAEVENFFSANNQLTQQLDRIEGRLRKLQRQLSELG